MMYESGVVAKIRGREGRKCYMDLERAVDIVAASNDLDLSMKEIADQIAEVTGVGRSGVMKSLSRAVEDIWENGDREALNSLYEYRLREKPTPKELIRRLATYRNRMVEYQIGVDQKGRYCLIAGNPVTKGIYRLIYLRDTTLTMERILCFLNRIQAPVEAVQQLFTYYEENNEEAEESLR